MRLLAAGLMICATAAAQYPAHWWTPIQDSKKPDWEILPQAAKPGEVILSKRNELGILSNFAATPFTFEGKHYASVEGFWQMMLYPEGASDPRARSRDVTWRFTRDQVCEMTGFEAKQAGTLAEENMRKIGIDWVTFDGQQMPYRSMVKGEHYRLIREAMRAKLDQNPKVRETLLATGNLVLRPDHIQELNAPPEWAYFQLWMEIRKDLQNTNSASVSFSEQPSFVVAGVTDHTYIGGHGSDAKAHSVESLTKATVSLKGSSAASDSEAERHHAAAEAAESAGNPLEAVREYQRAADLAPTEANLFDWGTELLTHGAPQAAHEVFEKGTSAYPRSSRMLLGAAVALYNEGAYSEAAALFFRATDIDPADPNPYVFLAQVHSAQITTADGYLDRMLRFAKVHPESAAANYHCAVALWNRRGDSNDDAIAGRVRSLLENALRLDPKLGEAELQLGIVSLERQDLPDAIQTLEKAVAIEPELDQAHYRLAAAYREAGQPQRADREIEIFRSIQKKQQEQHDREQSDLQRFVVRLKVPSAHE